LAALGYLEFILFFVFCALVTLLSFILDRCWASILPGRILHRIFLTPGIIVHELSHALACILTGASIQEISFFSEEGGHVTHTKSKIPLLGQPIISMAPMLGIPLFLLALSLIFRYFLGCWFLFSEPQLDSLSSAWDYFSIPFMMFKMNFYTFHNWWFILYLYLTLSLVVCLAPSGQDLRNSYIGLIALFILGLLVIFVSGYLGWGTPVMKFIIYWLYYAFGIGLMLEIIALIITIPIYLLTRMFRRHA
jgi:hypothetical protein